jgi:hypothetical protein
MVLRTAGALGAVLLSLLAAACNDRPTDIGAELVPGTDTLYSITSTDRQLLDSMRTVTNRLPMYNGTYVLLGKTTDSEARLFVEFLRYPQLGDTNDWTVIQSDLQFRPQEYTYGDTTDKTIAMRGYNLTQAWSAQANWDSIWAPDGSSSYYTTASTPVCDGAVTYTTPDSNVTLPVSVDAAREWLVKGADSATRVNELFGIVLLPTNSNSIHQIRNVEDLKPRLLLRVITKHKDSLDPDTTFIESVVACFVDSPLAKTNELIVQGARIHHTEMRMRVDSLPDYAVIVGAKFTITVDAARSQVGSFGPDELLELQYTALDGTLLRYQVLINENKEYVFPNISAIAQRIRKDGGSGTLTVYPSDAYETWRMNRLVFHDAASDPAKQPRFVVLYTVPTVFQ